MTPAFGAYAPSAAQERLRAIGHRLPANYIGRKTASMLLGLAGGRARRVYDVAVFDSQKARLHPYDNICEKRVFLTPQFWDPEERAALARAIARHSGSEFYFVDIGANVGLYSLFALAEARRRGVSLRSLCIEPDDEMRRRLAFNVMASGAEAAICIAPYAVAGKDGRARFSVNAQSRGMSRLKAGGETEIEARALAGLVRESGFARVDAMKIDIEGGENAALAPYFAASGAPRPAMIILETTHDGPECAAADLVIAAGYRTLIKTPLNSVLERIDP
jgi:FkbM family methyltransferase